MPCRPLTFLLTAIIAIHALAGSVGSTAVLCFGGGHEHRADESKGCEQACGHDASWPLTPPGEDHDRDCGCVDVELAVGELLALPRSAPEPVTAPEFQHSSTWGVLIAECGLGRRGPPCPALGNDPRGAHGLAIMASVRLTL